MHRDLTPVGGDDDYDAADAAVVSAVSIFKKVPAPAATRTHPKSKLNILGRLNFKAKEVFASPVLPHSPNWRRLSLKFMEL